MQRTSLMQALNFSELLDACYDLGEKSTGKGSIRPNWLGGWSPSPEPFKICPCYTSDGTRGSGAGDKFRQGIESD